MAGDRRQEAGDGNPPEAGPGDARTGAPVSPVEERMAFSSAAVLVNDDVAHVAVPGAAGGRAA